MSGPVRRPHVVTKAYLRAWADDRGTVDVLDLKRRHVIPLSINNATVVGGAYDPLVLSHDLEGEYASIENRGMPAIAKLRRGIELTPGEMTAVIAFLDMHLDRGRYAAQAGTVIPATLLKTDGSIENADFSVADRLRLSRSLPEVLRLASLGLDRWEWRVEPKLDGLITGDGAVLLFHEAERVGLRTIAFPLSPTQLLVIGEPIQPDTPINRHIVEASRRWIISLRGTLKMRVVPTTH
ncbi:hypothetical protein JG551_002989 [Curtobacterium flaccumfaciens pv. flaccumfaciens]|uniref:DUF4238 domain-containing protein n=1 Tax=Curtobacterium flaccumfaciens TaxID=2035 RepID=UPI001BD087CC|nr:DUF4238 domain-containing protein [Curtobacterium flaccumfaciens]QVG65554.1 hypothetical protein JG551_002989 [Curtobacterium flaccumfaciens pv. flaccumfaciens]